MATNPAVSLPETARVRAALARCPLVIVSDVVDRTDTLGFAHIRLPAAAWGEKSGTVTNSERRISRQRPFRKPPGEARPDWWILARVGRALGHARAFRYRSPADVFREHAALSAFENGGERAFDIGACARLSNSAYETLDPFRWPWRRGTPRDAAGRLYADGRFHTPDGRARMVPVATLPAAEAPSHELPLVANSGRYRDQWHTMTRTGLAARLAAHRPEPLVEIAPSDARAAGLEDGALARVESAHGAVLLRAAVSDAQQPGQVFLPIHWSGTNAAAAVVGRLVGAHLDPISGQPESKLTPVRVAPVRTAWCGLLLSRREPALAGIAYWCRQTAAECSIYELAGTEPVSERLVERLVPGGDLIGLDYRDDRRGIRRHAWLDGEDRLAACLFLAPARPRVARGWLRTLFVERLDGDARRALLAGRAADMAVGEAGRQVCACFRVGLHQIETAIREARAASVAEIGVLLSAGTGCGSCIPEIREILRHERSDAAA
jgi:assimilatory nitrate reductase catalytic subunit